MDGSAQASNPLPTNSQRVPRFGGWRPLVLSAAVYLAIRSLGPFIVGQAMMVPAQIPLRRAALTAGLSVVLLAALSRWVRRTPSRAALLFSTLIAVGVWMDHLHASRFGQRVAPVALETLAFTALAAASALLVYLRIASSEAPGPGAQALGGFDGA